MYVVEATIYNFCAVTRREGTMYVPFFSTFGLYKNKSLDDVYESVIILRYRYFLKKGKCGSFQSSTLHLLYQPRPAPRADNVSPPLDRTSS